MPDFLEDYRFATTNSQSPTEYHIWSALSTLSHAISKKVWVDQGIFKVYPNMYIFLVGSAGITKSTAMKISQKVIHKAGFCHYLGDSVTKEALLKMMADEKYPGAKVYQYEGKAIKYTHLSIFCNEFTTLINAGGNAVGYIDMLVNIWDQEQYKVQTLGRGIDYIPNPYISLLGCITTQTIQKLIDSELINSGMARRSIFVLADKNGEPVPRPSVSDEQKAAFDRCVERAKELQFVVGQFKWGEGLEQVFDGWYNENFYRAEDNTKHPALIQFLRSKPEYALKISMLLQLANSNELVLTVENFNYAVGLLDRIDDNVLALFGGTGKNPQALIANEIEVWVGLSKTPLAVKQVHARFMRDAPIETIDKILAELVKTDRIVMRAAIIKNVTIRLVMSPEVAQNYPPTN